MIIDLCKPVRSERVRGFQPPWYTVWVYECPTCKQEVRIKENWRGPAPPGAITCPHCNRENNNA